MMILGQWFREIPRDHWPGGVAFIVGAVKRVDFDAFERGVVNAFGAHGHGDGDGHELIVVSSFD
jgi:hypothetical protein